MFFLFICKTHPNNIMVGFVGGHEDGFTALDIFASKKVDPQKLQVVALYVCIDQSMINRCGFLGYQDILLSFGDVVAVFQKCQLMSLMIMIGQYDIIVAQEQID